MFSGEKAEICQRWLDKKKIIENFSKSLSNDD